jgi:hypothetical protein
MMGDYPDPAERDVLRDEEEVVAALMGDYIAQRERGAIPLADELLAQAAEFRPPRPHQPGGPDRPPGAAPPVFLTAGRRWARTKAQSARRTTTR